MNLLKQHEESMINITLPDGSMRQYDVGVTGLKVAESIGKRLAADAVAIRVNDELWDLTRPIDQDASVAILTRNNSESLEIFRHDAAHVLAQAVKLLFPDVQVTIGPAIENGFFYDFYREESFTPEDLEKIEQKMKELVDQDHPFTREVWTRNQAIDYFQSKGEEFKVEIIKGIPENESITIYSQGNFVDPCRGPHLPSTGRLGKAFKLTKLAGAYWRGDSNNVMLQRIYGTAWSNEKQLQDYLHMLEEAEKRDHRKLGLQLNLFHQQEESPGCVFWHPKGWTLYRLLQNYIRARIEKQDYLEVNTPILLDRHLWEQSGHWEKFRENMFTTQDGDGDHVLAMKPMNCPAHVQIFKKGIKSYRDLPLRMAEFGCCHRNEPSGALHGTMRVRAFVQDDAHIFCTEDQITAETKKFCELLLSIYKDLGFDSVIVKLSDRPAKRAGSDETWDKAEKALKDATTAAGLDYSINPGEGAFYGPKLEFVLKDAIGRDWQCGTFQVDFVLPERLDANYIAEDGQKRRPVMLHRAVLGAFERFIAIYIEHHAGKFPLWLSPIQVGVVPISEESHGYAEEVAQELKSQGLRVELDLRSEKMNYKIREMSLQKIPVIYVVGKREAEERTVAIRRLGQDQQETLALDVAIAKLKEEARSPAEA
jgi:threonyl-tRNA synthetase